eukprot:401844-Amphidinium_carterae.1
MTSVAQPLDTSYMRTCESILGQFVAKHFAELYIANNEEFEVKKGSKGGFSSTMGGIQRTMCMLSAILTLRRLRGQSLGKAVLRCRLHAGAISGS